MTVIVKVVLRVGKSRGDDGVMMVMLRFDWGIKCVFFVCLW